jgi:dinuclear metal center YbgI/SA1388 family protein
MESIAPTRHAESWDNVGLLVGDPRQPVARVLLTIDLTRPVFEEAVSVGCDCVIAYHPPIFEPIKRLNAGSVVHDAIHRGMAIYSPHTALDVAPHGTNDVLADALYLAERRPIRPLKPSAAGNVKLVTFVPAENVESLAEALGDAGAGVIGDYARCSFRTPGTGTFLGGESTSPAVGRKQTLEHVAEIRLEMLVPFRSLESCLAALREKHPYEEPAFDLVPLLEAPAAGVGMGRIGSLPEPVARDVLIARIKRELMIDHVLVAGPINGEVTTVACCAGSCGSMLDDAIAQGTELFLTGELRHHDAIKAARLGVTVVATLHSNSERRALTRLAESLTSRMPKLSVQVSRQDRDPFAVL